MSAKSNNFYLATIQFNLDEKPVEFKIVHNLPEQQGLRLQAALDAWLARTSTFTANSFCKYIMKVRTGYIAMPEQRFTRITNQIK